MADTKTIVKNTGFLYVRMAITMLIGLFSVRIILKALGEVDYGVYNVVSGIITMLAFLNNALSSTTQRFLSYELPSNDTERLKRVFSTSIIIYLYLCLAIVFIGETIGLWFVNSKLNIPSDRMYAANWIYQFSIITFCFSVMSAPYNAAIIAHEKMGIYAYVSIAEAILKLALIVILLYAPGDKLIVYGIMLCMISIIVFFFYFFYCRHQFRECHFVKERDKEMMASLGSFAKWNVFGTFSNIFSGQGINILLNIFFGVIVNTARGIAYQIDNAINTLVQNFYLAVKPQIVKQIAEKNVQETNYLLLVATKVGYLLFSSIAIVVVLEMRTILNVWLGYYSGLMVTFSRIVLLGYLFEVLLNPLNTVISGTGRIKPLMLSNGVLTIMILPISYFMLKAYTIEVVPFVVILLTSIVRWINGIFQTKRVFNLNTKAYLNLVAILFLTTSLTFGVAYLLHSILLNRWVRMFCVLFVVVSLYSVLSWFCILSKKEKNACRNYLIRLFRI